MISSYQYDYDAAGNRKSEKVTIGDKYTNTLYSYNALNRLTATLNSSGEETRYLYDNNGNLLNKSVGASTMETMADTMQVGADSSVQAELPSFDLMITTSSDFGTGTKNLTQYTYNKFNRLTTMKDEDSTASYVYNAQGYRVEKTVNGQTTDYLYEGDKVVLETDKSGNQKAVQVYGNNLLSRTVTGAEKYYYLYNAHGDVTSLFNTSGVVAASYDYDAFGNIINKTGAANNSILYAGYQHDDESGLYYLNARYYDSVTARFITEDTYTGEAKDPLSLNLYTYCNNNPIKYDDPSGHWPTVIVHVTLTEKVAKEEFSTYLEDQVEGKVVYKTDKKGNVKYKDGYKIIDEKKSDKNATEWLKEQRKQADVYVNALAAGDKYIDQENTIFQRTGFPSDSIFHGRKDGNQKNDINNPQVFINERKSTAATIISSSTYNKKGAITAFIINPALSILDNYTGAYDSSLNKIKSDVEDKTVEKIVGKKTVKTIVNVFKDDSAYDSAYKYMSGPNATKETAAMFTWGMGLHTLQDTYSHGNITKDKQHIDANDDPTVDSWSYDKNGKIIVEYGNDRITNTENATKDYIDTIIYGDGTKNNPGYGSVLFTPYSSTIKNK